MFFPYLWCLAGDLGKFLFDALIPLYCPFSSSSFLEFIGRQTHAAVKSGDVCVSTSQQSMQQKPPVLAVIFEVKITAMMTKTHHAMA